MTTQLITRNYNNLTFTFRDDGYFNMTSAARCFGKRVDNFMSSTETKEYLDALRTLKSSELKIIEVKRGSGACTWAHPKLAIFFARWLDVRFAVWCDAMIEVPTN